MRKIIIAGISLLILACAPLSSFSALTQNTHSPDPLLTATPDSGLINQYVAATVSALALTATQAVTPGTGCDQLLCPTCAAAEVNSPILPAPPTVAVGETATSEVAIPKAVDVATVTPTATVTMTPIPAMPYQAQSSTPVYLINFAHQDQGCNWQGLAGQVFDLDGNPAKNVVLIVSGQLNGKTVNSLGMTGTTSLYGPGGYEIILGNKPVASSGSLSVTVYGLNGMAQSNPVTFNTLNDCQKNLTLVNFKQVK